MGVKNAAGRESGKILTYAASLVAITLWGASYIWSDRLIQAGISIFYFVFARILIAGLLLLVMNLCIRQFVKIKRKDLPAFLLLALCEPFIYFLCETYGIKLTGSPTISALAIATIPIFSIFAGVMFFREKVYGINIAGILLCIGGIVLVAMASGALGDDFVWGLVFLLTAVIAEVAHASLTKKLSGGYASSVIVMYQFLIGSVYLLPLFIFKGLDNFDPAVHLRWDVWEPILCLAVFCSSAAFTLWVSTIKKLGVAKSSIFSALIPVASALIAWISGREILSLRQWAGVAICVVGIILSQLSKKAKSDRLI